MHKRWVFFVAVACTAAGPAVGGPQETAWERQIIAADRLVAQAQFAEAEQVLLRTIREVEAVRPDTPLLLTMMNNLGVLYYNTGRFADAERYFRNAIRLSRQTGEQNASSRIRAMLNLGNMYLDLRRLSQAERVIRQAEAERSFENDDGGKPWREHSLAVLWFYLGDLAKAEAFSRRAVQLWESDPGVKDESLAFALNLLATVLMKLNRGEEAMLVVRRMLGLMSGITLIPPLSRARLLSGCAEVVVFAGSPAEAEALASEAVGIAQKFLGPNNSFLAPILSSQAGVLLKLNRKREAKKVAERARRIVQSAAGKYPALSVIDVHELARER